MSLERDYLCKDKVRKSSKERDRERERGREIFTREYNSILNLSVFNFPD
jgi:hypothetical protein